MSVNSTDEQPIIPLESKSNIISDTEEEEEEEKKAIPLYQNQSYQHELSHHSDRSNSSSYDSKSSDEDIAHSSLLLCRIAIFLYAFVSILLTTYFPEEESAISAKYQSWFKLFMSLNIIGCILGTTGVYLNKPKWLFICWILNAVSLCLLGILVIAYIFIRGEDPNYDGIELESRNRCNDWLTDENFNPMRANYGTLNECLPKMRLQILWTVGLLYVIYLIACSFGIHVMRTAQIHMDYCNFINQPERSDSYDTEDESISDLSDEYQEIDDGPFPPKKKTSSYDISLDEIEQKKK